MNDLPVPLSFEWDEGNREKNWVKHKVKVEECEQTFFDEAVKIFEEKGHSQNGKRYVAYGRTNSQRRLTIVFTVRNRKIRVISARDQNRKERRLYET